VIARPLQTIVRLVPTDNEAATGSPPAMSVSFTGQAPVTMILVEVGTNEGQVPEQERFARLSAG
jgi:hypothetical protein